MNAKTNTPLSLEELVEALAANPLQKRRRKLRKGMVVLVDGQECVKVPLTRGKFAIIDAINAPLILCDNWIAMSGHSNCDNWYAYKSAVINGQTKNIQMHRFIFGLVESFPFLDHKNGDGLDNRETNLRVATQSQNLANARKRAGCWSRYKGVSKCRLKWQAYVNGPKSGRFHLGTYSSEEAAAKAYDLAAVKLYGEFAKTNFTP